MWHNTKHLDYLSCCLSSTNYLPAVSFWPGIAVYVEIRYAQTNVNYFTLKHIKQIKAYGGMHKRIQTHFKTSMLQIYYIINNRLHACYNYLNLHNAN